MDHQAMLEVALAEARAGCEEGGVPIGGALFDAAGRPARPRPQPARAARRPVRARRDGGVPQRRAPPLLPRHDDRRPRSRRAGTARADPPVRHRDSGGRGVAHVPGRDRRGCASAASRWSTSTRQECVDLLRRSSRARPRSGTRTSASRPAPCADRPPPRAARCSSRSRPAWSRALMPLWLTGFGCAPWWAPLRVLGALLVVAGAAMLVSRVRAASWSRALGTPAPVAPTEHLVVGGLYRYVRNPMYVAVTADDRGGGAGARAAGLLAYAAVVWAAMAAFVSLYEEPTLARPVRRAVRGVPARRPGVVAAAQRGTIARLSTFASRPLPTPSVMRTTTLSRALAVVGVAAPDRERAVGRAPHGAVGRSAVAPADRHVVVARARIRVGVGERRDGGGGADCRRLALERRALGGDRVVEPEVEPGDLAEAALGDPERAVRAGDERSLKPPGMR